LAVPPNLRLLGELSEETSLSLVCEENFGSGNFTDSTAVSPSRISSPVVSTLAFFRYLFGLDILVQGARHCGAQRGQMGAAVALRDIISKALYRFLIGIVPLHRDLGGDAVFFADRIKHRGVQRRFVTVHIFDKTFDAATEGKIFFLAVRWSISAIFTPVIEERQFTQTFRQNIEVKLNQPKGFFGSQKMDDGTFLFESPTTFRGATGSPWRNSIKCSLPSR